MKKILLMSTTLVAITSPIISLVGCDNNDKEYELTIIDEADSHIRIEPTKFKLNQELVIHYSCDNEYAIDENESIINVGGVIYCVKDLSYDSSTVTLPADKVNDNKISVRFKAVVKQYDLIIEDVDSNVHVQPTKFKLNNDLVINYSLEDNYYLDIDSEVVTINGVKYTIKDLTFNAEAITIPASKVNTNKISIALKTKSIPADRSFANDSWSTFCAYANEGINKLYEVYDYERSTNYEYPGTLIGLVRIVKINGYDHKVGVIGQNQDYLDPEKQNPVALTFQFFTQASGASGNAMITSWDGSGPKNENYWNSELWHKLADEGRTGSIADLIINGDNDGLYEQIKSVSRTVNTKQDGEWVATTDSTKIFVSALSNLFSREGLIATDDNLINDSLVDKYCAEGEQYQYYSKETKIGDLPIKYDYKEERNSFECLIFNPIKPRALSYWLCSPNISNQNIWAVDRDDATLVYYDSTTGFGYNPCFCI